MLDPSTGVVQLHNNATCPLHLVLTCFQAEHMPFSAWLVQAEVRTNEQLGYAYLLHRRSHPSRQRRTSTALSLAALTRSSLERMRFPPLLVPHQDPAIRKSRLGMLN